MTRDLAKLYGLLTKRERYSLILLLCSMLLVALFEIISIGSVPIVLQLILDPSSTRSYSLPETLASWISEGDVRTRLFWGSAIFIFIFLLRSVVVTASSYVQLHFSANRQTRIASLLFSSYLHAPYETFLKNDSSTLIRNLQTGAMRIGGEIVNQVLSLTQNAIVLLAITAFLFYRDPLVAFSSISILGLFSFLFSHFTSTRSRKLGQNEMEKRKQQIRQLREVFEGIKEVQLSGRQAHFTQEFSSGIRAISRAQEHKLFLGFLATPLMELLAICVLFLVPFILISQGKSLEESSATVSMFALAFFRLKSNITGILSSLTQLRFNMVNIGPITEDLKLGERASGKLISGPYTPESITQIVAGNLRVEDIRYRYPGSDSDALCCVNFQIPTGSRLAITGSSGSGKSTLLDILLGVLKPTSGRVLINDLDIHANANAWHQCISLVPQHIFLINDSLRRNIAFGLEDDEIDEERLAECIKMAALQELVDSLPEGLDTLAAERGLRLSGGQKQRMVIARALYRKPKFLFLDEATSALDTDSEQALADTLRRLPAELTLITVSHRKAFIEGYDYLLSIDDGKVISFETVVL